MWTISSGLFTNRLPRNFRRTLCPLFFCLK